MGQYDDGPVLPGLSVLHVGQAGRQHGNGTKAIQAPIRSCPPGSTSSVQVLNWWTNHGKDSVHTRQVGDESRQFRTFTIITVGEGLPSGTTRERSRLTNGFLAAGSTAGPFRGSVQAERVDRFLSSPRRSAAVKSLAYFFSAEASNRAASASSPPAAACLTALTFRSRAASIFAALHRSETVVRVALHQLRESLIPWRLSKQALTGAMLHRLDRLVYEDLTATASVHEGQPHTTFGHRFGPIRHWTDHLWPCHVLPKPLT